MPWLSLKRGMPGARAGRRWGRRLHPSPASTSPIAVSTSGLAPPGTRALLHTSGRQLRPVGGSLLRSGQPPPHAIRKLHDDVPRSRRQELGQLHEPGLAALALRRRHDHVRRLLEALAPTVRGCRTPTPSRLSAEARQKGVAVPFGETGICTTTGSPRSGGRQGKSTGVCPPKMRTNGLRLAVAAARAVAESAIPTRNPATKRRIRVPTFLFRPYDE